MTCHSSYLLILSKDNFDLGFISFQLCEELFEKINDNSNEEMSYSVEVSMVSYQRISVCWTSN